MEPGSSQQPILAAGPESQADLGIVAQLLADPELRARLGAAAHGHVRQHFLLTRHLGDMLALMATLIYYLGFIVFRVAGNRMPKTAIVRKRCWQRRRRCESPGQ